MIITKKEILEFSPRETDALNLVTEICLGLVREASNPDLKKLAEETYEKLEKLWEWEE